MSHGRASPPSYHNGYARSPGQSAYPDWWRGLEAWAVPALGPTGFNLKNGGLSQIDGTLTGMAPDTAWLISGNERLPGYAIDFGGVGSGDFVDYGNNIGLVGSLQLTVFGWIHPTSLGGTQTRIWDKDGGTGSNDWGWGFRLAGASNDSLALTINSTDTDWDMFATSQPVVLSEWQFVLASWDGVTETCVFERNGVDAGFDSSSGGVYNNVIATNTESCRLGARADGNREFQGMIGSMLLYSRFFTPSERQFVFEHALAPLELRRRFQWKSTAAGVTVPDDTYAPTMQLMNSGGYIGATIH